MRLEFNPRALCYNLYCDTREEQEKMKRMLETPLTANEMKYIENDVLATKNYLNSLYGKAVTDMNKSYITVMVSGSPIIIFKSHIVSIEKRGDKASIYCSNGESYDPSNKYVDIVKQVLD